MTAGGFDRRLKRLNANLHRGIEDVFARGLNDPRVRGMVSVTGVEIARDLKTAKVSVSVFPHEHEPLTMHALRDAAPHIRRRLMDRVEMRDMPRLVFELDEGLKQQAEVMTLLARAREEREARGAEDDGPDTGTTAGEPAHDAQEPPAP